MPVADWSNLVAAAVPALAVAAAWGGLRATLEATRKQQDERHEENRDMLREIRDDVKRINGTVAAHEARIDNLEGGQG